MESLEFIQEILRHLDYFWVTVLMAIESSFIPFPSEVVVPPAAWRAANGELNIFLVVFFATVGSNIGALVNYYLAKYLGRPMVYRFAESKVGRICLLSREKVEKAEQYFQKNGATSTLIGRLIPGIRQLISVPAGMAGMSLGSFLLYTTIGAGVWNIVLASLGYFLGANQALLITYSKTIGIAIAFIVLIGAVSYYLYKKSKNR